VSAGDPREFAKLLKRPLADLPRALRMVPLPGPFEAVVTPPGSKSITNRALLMAALAEGESHLSGALLDADDAKVMIAALRQLGATIEIEDEQRGCVRVVGTGGRLKGNCTLNLNNAGTATRFLTAAACLADGPVVIDGNARMRQRPIGELVELLRELGVKIDELGSKGCVPIRVHPGKFTKDRVTVGTTLSSQFISALMLVAPLMPHGLTIHFRGAITSPSYIEMTAGLVSRLGCAKSTGVVGEAGLTMFAGRPRGFRYEVEPDASGATYFWGAAAIAPASECVVLGIDADSLQGDAAFRSLLDRMAGADRTQAMNADLTLMPDAAMTLGAVACFATGTTTIKGLRTLRDKETDRIAAICAELKKVGVRAEAFEYADARGAADEGIRLTPPEGGIDLSPSAPPVEFDTYDDHRMAMSLALIGLRRPNVAIRDPGCVAKTYPGFWRDLSTLYDSAFAARDTGSGA